ncbi:MAG: Methionyl-tRNA formyltransferase [Candidatus Moranbacteria bacterium GW2011_GWE1_49_15]|nr:MAG: Methionyl-tRNA formyltransferase [Candidatus Moranbacteria bacterium GW2011_GWE2_47_10]KKW07072.1 MAG: Methionyl-tRNA formyltransferase [Candidatus Moranbacteria bacterium GW2011_GWE1_49_15]HBP01424.1 methionyl-tRNA formyltransferase [Candidatus Moranbacteria bacterium]
MMEQNKHIKLRTVFMGTSDFAKEILEALVHNDFNIVGVFTKPDSKVGRKQELSESPVKKLASEKDIPVFQPEKFNEEAVSEFKNLKPDLVIVAAYGRLLPKKVLEAPGLGCLNIHPSLLPKFRGPSPIQNALLLGEKETGTTIMLLDEGMDTGDILSQERIRIEDYDNAETLSKKLSELSIHLLLKTVPLWVRRQIEPRKQDGSHATLCQLIEREDGRIVWEQDAQEIHNRYRALYPWPGIFAFWKNGDSVMRLKLIKISLQKNNPATHHETGEIFQLGESIGVQAINGVIILEEIQPEGKKTMSAQDFSNGYPNFIGSILS